MAFNYILLLNYILCMLFGTMIVVIPMRNYVVTWIKVKLPFFKDADLQVHIKRSGGDYFVTGSYGNGQLWYLAKPRKDNPKPWRKLDVSQEEYNSVVYRANGVPCIDVDDVKNCILVWNGKEYKAIEGSNAEASAEAVFTALQKPSTEGQGYFSAKGRDLVIVAIGLIVGISAYVLFKKIGLVDTHIRMLYDMIQPMYYAGNYTVNPLVLSTGFGG